VARMVDEDTELYGDVTQRPKDSTQDPPGRSVVAGGLCGWWEDGEPDAGTHACNPSYSGGRGQDRGSKPASGKWFLRPHLKKPFTKKGWWSGSDGRAAAWQG
jgi:hypothetical protein